jgi:hypothetical protein
LLTYTSDQNFSVSDLDDLAELLVHLEAALQLPLTLVVLLPLVLLVEERDISDFLDSLILTPGVAERVDVDLALFVLLS